MCLVIRQAKQKNNHREDRGLTFQDLVIDSLFTGNDQVEMVLTALEPFRSGLDALVAVQHVKDSILGIPSGVGWLRSTATWWQTIHPHSVMQLLHTINLDIEFHFRITF